MDQVLGNQCDGSLKLDLAIFVETLFVVLNNKRAIENTTKNRPLNLILLAGLLTFPISAAMANGSVWSYRDDDGATHFSSVPDGSSYRLYLKDPGNYRLKSDRIEDNFTEQTAASLAWPIDQHELPFAALVTAAAAEQRIDPALLHAIIHVESRHNPSAVSAKGAIGLMQVLPETARRMGVESISTPKGNINAGARYMRFLLDNFGKDIQLALAAYNAGETAVIRYGNQIPPYPETRAYVPAVIAAYRELSTRKRQVSDATR